MSFVYIDESGDLGTKRNSSKNFIIAAIKVEDSKKLEKIIKKTRRLYRKKMKTSNEIKGGNLPYDLKIKILRGINMNTVEIIFSPTGGTRKVSEIITNNWNLDTQRIDLTNPHLDYGEFEIGEDDIVLIAMPVFGSHPPAVAIERLRQVNGNKARCVVVCVYGKGDYGNTLNEMKIAAEGSDFKVVAAIAAVAQHSIIPEYATDRPDEDDISVLNDFAEKIRDKKEAISTELDVEIEDEATESKPQPPSEPPLPKPTDSCIKCGICASNCPLEAICEEDFTADIMKCIFCMRCQSQCPNKSRKVDDDVVSKAAVALKDTCSGRKENELFI